MNTITARDGTTIDYKDLGDAEEVAESGAESYGGQSGDFKGVLDRQQSAPLSRG